MEIHRVTGIIYSPLPGEDRHHLISISSYLQMKMHALSFPTFGLTRFVQDVVDTSPGEYHIFSPNALATPTRTTVSPKFNFNVARGALEC
jgi:hypothetical protein